VSHDLRVLDRPAERAFKLYAGEREAGSLRYAKQGDRLVLVHTEIDPAFEGEGLGSTLVRGALDDVRARGLEVVPVCPFVRRWLARHLEYADVVVR
jgi:uncharacterized protein